MSAQELKKQLAECEKQCTQLKKKIDDLKGQTSEKMLSDVVGGAKAVTDRDRQFVPEVRTKCIGHFGKIYSLHWGPDSRHLVTASQDGKLIVWNGTSGNKQLAITLTSAWVMTCAFAPSFDFIASGGLDNTVSVYSTTARSTGDDNGKFRDKTLKCELEKHDGYLSCCRFVSDQRLLSSSGDGTCILWDIENTTPVTQFADHSGDVMSIDLKHDDPNLFVSGSVDTNIKIYDMRNKGSATANFSGHEGDVNAVKWFPDGHCVCSGSDDGTARLFDTRSYRQLNKYKNSPAPETSETPGVTSIDTSRSGQYIFSACDSGSVLMWHTLAATQLRDLSHPNRVSSLGVTQDGYALATGCWDFHLRVYA